LLLGCSLTNTRSDLFLCLKLLWMTKPATQDV
jgi:hypothetical protein